MRRRLLACMIACLGLAVVSLVLHSNLPTTKANDETLVTRNYAVADLPVWKDAGPREGTDPGKFDPANMNVEYDATVLIALIKAATPDAWSNGGSMKPFAKSASLVIRQTQKNHDRICDLLSQVRKDVESTMSETKKEGG